MSLMRDQEAKYKAMIEAEIVKDDVEAVRVKENEEKSKKEGDKKAEREKMRLKLVGDLKDEPLDGRVINIAFRLPNGSRLTRNFRQEDMIMVDLGSSANVLICIFERRPDI